MTITGLGIDRVDGPTACVNEPADSGASYSTFVVGDAVRNGYLSIEEAVHLISDQPARLYGVRPGIAEAA